MKVDFNRRNRAGWCMAITTKRYRRSLFVPRPMLTKLGLRPDRKVRP